MDIALSILRRGALRLTFAFESLCLVAVLLLAPADSIFAFAPPAAPRTETARYRVDAAANATVKFALPSGPRAIDGCELRISDSGNDNDADARNRWSNVRIHLQWDDAAIPAVSLTASEFWGFRRHESAENEAERAWDRHWSRDPQIHAEPPRDRELVFFARWPMGYQRQGFLIIETPGPCRGEIRVHSRSKAPARPVYFHARAFPPSRDRDPRARGASFFALTPENVQIRGEWIGVRMTPPQAVAPWILRADDRAIPGASPLLLADNPAEAAFHHSLRLEFPAPAPAPAPASTSESSSPRLLPSATCFWRSDAP